MAVTPDPERWQAELAKRRREWLDMLGLDPLPERTDLCVTPTGLLDRGHYVIEKLHFQPVPGCRIAANLYRPKVVTAPLPAVVYVCGHAASGKAWYQPHARWFGEHGYVCLILDTIEIGEMDGTHHGLYREGWWHWISQGYSPAAVEVWYAMRAADYLQGRDDVDGQRLGITGNSGGGSISWYTGAADERFAVVVPSCQTGTMEQHVRDRTLDGHCDCAVWVNNLAWDLTDVAALIAPRPLLVASASEDTIWRPWSNRELLGRVRRLYRALGCEEHFDVVEDVIPHGYSPKTRTAIFGWFERHLKGALRPPADDVREELERDEDLWAFPDGRPPADDRTKRIHEFFLPLPAPGMAELDPAARLRRLREWTFRHIPVAREAPAYEARPRGCSSGIVYTQCRFETEPGLWLNAWLAMPEGDSRPTALVVGAARSSARLTFLGQGAGLPILPGVARGVVDVRGTGDTSIGPGLEWFVRRAYPLLGQSLPERWVYDLLRGLDVLCEQAPQTPVVLFGTAETAAVAIYAALLEPRVAEVVLHEPSVSHWQAGPEFCGVLRFGDLPENAGLLCPRPLTFIGRCPEPYAACLTAYESLGAAGAVRTVAGWAEWRPAVSR